MSRAVSMVVTWPTRESDRSTQPSKNASWSAA